MKFRIIPPQAGLAEDPWICCEYKRHWWNRWERRVINISSLSQQEADIIRLWLDLRNATGYFQRTDIEAAAGPSHRKTDRTCAAGPSPDTSVKGRGTDDPGLEPKLDSGAAEQRMKDHSDEHLKWILDEYEKWLSSEYKESYILSFGEWIRSKLDRLV